MFDDANVRVAQAVGGCGDVQAVAKIIGGRFFLGLDIGKELNAELHAGSFRRAGAVACAMCIRGG
jgi:hypothetical protein